MASKDKKAPGEAAVAEAIANAEVFSGTPRDWEEGLIQGKNGGARPLLFNALLTLRGSEPWLGVLAYNEFSGRIMARRPPPWEAYNRSWAEREWTDHDDLLTAEWLQGTGVPVGVEIAAQAVQTIAGERRYHPVRDYLQGLRWDDTPRLSNWLVLHLGVDTSPYVRAVSRRFLIAAVARIYQPGAKSDCALILEGPQGAGKSTALRTLSAPWFTDEIADFGSREAAEQTSGVWFIEIAELGSLSRPAVAKIKAFMSRSVDRYRPAYGRRVMDFPRQCVFAGTVNGDDYLRDETGGRRFWPVRCGEIDLEVLAAARDQLWAEAVHAFRAGETWWLDSAELIQAANEEQGKRYRGDPWDEIIAVYLQAPEAQSKRTGGKGKDSLSVNEILERALEIEPSRQSQADMNRVARCLRSLGWERFQDWNGGRRRWLYRPIIANRCSSGDE